MTTANLNSELDQIATFLDSIFQAAKAPAAGLICPDSRETVGPSPHRAGQWLRPPGNYRRRGGGDGAEARREIGERGQSPERTP